MHPPVLRTVLRRAVLSHLAVSAQENCFTITHLAALHNELTIIQKPTIHYMLKPYRPRDMMNLQSKVGLDERVLKRTASDSQVIP